MAASRHNQPVETSGVFRGFRSLKRLPDLLLTLFQAGVVRRLDVNHTGQTRGEIGQRIRVHNPRDTRVATTHKDTNTRFFLRHISLRRKAARLVPVAEERILTPIGSCTDLVGEQAHHVAGRARCVQNRLRDLLGRGERSTDVDAWLARLQRDEFVRRTETVGIQLNPQHVR